MRTVIETGIALLIGFACCNLYYFVENVFSTTDLLNNSNAWVQLIPLSFQYYGYRFHFAAAEVITAVPVLVIGGLLAGVIFQKAALRNGFLISLTFLLVRVLGTTRLDLTSLLLLCLGGLAMFLLTGFSCNLGSRLRSGFQAA